MAFRRRRRAGDRVMKRLRDMLAGLRGAVGPDNRTVVHISEPQPKHPPEGKIAIVAIYRNETADIEEWIDYHRLIGVEKFFLYDNDTTDDTNLKLRRYVQSGHVEIMPWPHFMRDTNTEAAAYAHAIARLAGRFEWLSMIDIDEFLVPTQGEALAAILNDFASYPTVLLHWYMFGPSGHRTRPQGGVIGNYTQRQKMPQEAWHAPADTARVVLKTKYLVQPSLVRREVGVHEVGTILRPLRGYNDVGQPIRKKGEAVGGSRLRINHYFTKSLAELEAKLAGPICTKPNARPASTRVANIMAGFAAENCLEDRLIIDLVQRMGGLPSRSGPDPAAIAAE